MGARIDVELQPDAAGDLRIVRLVRPRDFRNEAATMEHLARCGFPMQSATPGVII